MQPKPSPKPGNKDFSLLRGLLPPRHSYETAVIRLDEVPEETSGHWLTREEQRSYAGLRSGKRKREWLAGRLAAKTAVALLLELPLPPALEKINIPSLADGRPLAEYPRPSGLPLEISISHSGGLATAMAADFPCGIDVQQLDTAAVRVRDRFSIPAEYAILSELLPLLSEMEHLCLLWTAKEALRKMISGTPLTGFRELLLLEGTATGRQQALLRFSAARAAGAAFQAAVFLRPGYAWSITGRLDAETNR